MFWFESQQSDVFSTFLWIEVKVVYGLRLSQGALQCIVKLKVEYMQNTLKYVTIT